ncbi:MAG: sugar phosphate isomerase/epimerase family protein [Phycisphaerae bacterium]
MDFSVTTDQAGMNEDVAVLFPAFATAGFKFVHWCQHWAGTPVFYDKAFAERTLALAREWGLAVADIHGYSGPDEGTTYTDELFLAANINRAEFAQRVGADVLVVHLPLRGRRDYRNAAPADMAAAVEHASAMLDALRKPCMACGVRVALENLGPPADREEFFDPLLARFGEDYLGFCYDSGHALIYGRPGLIERYCEKGRRLIATHLHDNDGTADQHRPPGEGKVDWPMIIRAMRRCGYAKAPNLELIKPKELPLLPYCQRGFQLISKLFAD